MRRAVLIGRLKEANRQYQTVEWHGCICILARSLWKLVHRRIGEVEAGEEAGRLLAP